jgi:RNA polymerase sigma-70 factor (ECF subfamily)
MSQALVLGKKSLTTRRPASRMVETPDNEARLVELAISGDFDAFAALYSLHLNAIYRYIYFRTGDQQDAEDLTEQVFLKAWEALSNYRPVGRRFINWLYRISHNIVVDHHRRNKLIADDPLNETGLADNVQDLALERIIQSEENAALAVAIKKLPEEYQQIIILRFIEGLGHADVARILEKSEVACRGMQYRALNSLNQILAGLQKRV